MSNQSFDTWVSKSALKGYDLPIAESRKATWQPRGIGKFWQRATPIAIVGAYCPSGLRQELVLEEVGAIDWPTFCNDCPMGAMSSAMRRVASV